MNESRIFDANGQNYIKNKGTSVSHVLTVQGIEYLKMRSGTDFTPFLELS